MKHLETMVEMMEKNAPRFPEAYEMARETRRCFDEIEEALRGLVALCEETAGASASTATPRRADATSAASSPCETDSAETTNHPALPRSRGRASHDVGFGG